MRQLDGEIPDSDSRKLTMRGTMSANEGGGNEGSSGNGCGDNGRGNELAMQKVLKVSVSINFDANTVHIQMHHKRAIQI